MAEVTNELMFEVLKQVQFDVAAVKDTLRETNASLNAVRIHMVGLQQDISNLYTAFGRHDERLARIERRLDIVEVS